MAGWLRLNADFAEHPQILAGGFAARATFVLLLTIAKRFGSGGIIPPAASRADYLAALWGAPEDLIRAGLDALIASGAIALKEHDAISIPGWDRYQPDPRTSGRLRALSQGHTGTYRDIQDVPPDGTGRDGTGRNTLSTPSEPTGRGGHEERGGEAGKEAEKVAAREARAPETPKPPPNPDVARVRDAFLIEWAKHDGEVKPAWGPAEAATAKRLLKRASLATIVAAMPGYWLDKFRTYTTHRGFLDFAGKFDAVRAAQHEDPGPRRAPNPNAIPYERLGEPER